MSLRVSVCMQDLAHTVRTRLAEQPRFEAPKRPPHGFSVDHYAGKVTYSTLLLMDKNKDFVIAEHAALLKASGFQFAR
jgi:myosin-5